MSHQNLWYTTNANRDANAGVENPEAHTTMLRHAALGGSTPGMADALGILAFYAYLDDIGFHPVDWAVSALRRSVAALRRSADPSPEKAVPAVLEMIRTVAPRPSGDSIPVEQLAELFREVRRHQWLEAEKAGRNVWAERCPEDPDGFALRDWMARHYASWRAQRRRMPTAA